MNRKSLRVFGLVIAVPLVFLVMTLPDVAAMVPEPPAIHDGDVIPQPGPDWRYELLYNTSDGSILGIVAWPPDQLGATTVHDGEALLNLTGQLGYAIYQDAKRDQLNLWHMDLPARTPVRRVPPSSVAASGLPPPVAIAALVLVAGGGLGLAGRAKWRTRTQVRRDATKRGGH